jgi:hypothetical protein
VKRSLFLAAGFALAVVGCGGGPTFAPVSGIVYLDDKPYPDAVISFQPLADKNDNPGRGSSSYTDAEGKFVLKTDDGTRGAVVGKHRVRIMTKGNDVISYDPALGSPDGDPNNPGKPPGKLDPIPAEWHALSTKEFDVPAGGTDKAVFKITSLNAGKKK